MSSYTGTENKGNPIILAKDPIASATSSITFDGIFDDTFSEYWVTLFDVTLDATSGQQVLFKWRNSGSDITGTYYRNYRAISMNSDNTTTTSNASYTDYNAITDYDMGTDSTREALNSVMYLFPRSANIKYNFNDNLFVADSSNIYGSEFIGALDTATTMDGFSVYASSGNIAGGEVCVYGVKK
jgi:hypothetical protein|tara:strand:+ start:2663 stop:3214 length:552 start_codon:yes stop_codon:yes gene_type:complete